MTFTGVSKKILGRSGSGIMDEHSARYVECLIILYTFIASYRRSGRYEKTV